MKVLEIDNVFKNYGAIKAVRGVSFDLEAGEIYGLLGPNGAGKSTLINMICGLLNISQGEIRLFGERVGRSNAKIKSKLGLVPQDIAVYNNLTAADNIKFFCGLHGYRGKDLKERSEKALAYVGLLDKADTLPVTFSGGMKRRLNIACAIAHTPKLIILDEPTVGIDPQSRNHILESIKKLNEKGATIIYTSHYMEEVEAICSRVGVIDHGKLIAMGTKEELKDAVSNINRIIVTLEEQTAVDIKGLKEIAGIVQTYYEEGVITIEAEQAANNFDQIILYLTEKKMRIKNIEQKKPSLETVFMALTGRTLRD
ncbi:MAG: ABC transporter ATP-binding protein [Firmicutes bacterium]|nr:ABC transporter ATP-binding protein [Bacillota bacterium]